MVRFGSLESVAINGVKANSSVCSSVCYNFVTSSCAVTLNADEAIYCAFVQITPSFKTPNCVNGKIGKKRQGGVFS
jgi:hypothetical protein